MFDPLEIGSYRGLYQVKFEDRPFVGLDTLNFANVHFIVDRKVFALYKHQLEITGQGKSLLFLDAEERAKDLSQVAFYVEHLVTHHAKRSDQIVAIGGGIMQDIACFLSSILFRGMGWRFFPTTLLAQADSCIGSKSSINVGAVKNLVGTFHAPQMVHISPSLLSTLEKRDLRSGVGEMIKVHIIDGKQSFEAIEKSYDELFLESRTLTQFIRTSLCIKKRIIEQDEFDSGIRNVMNYGHSFGHALETATAFAVPHGVAVTIGMDIANFYALQTGRISETLFHQYHSLLARNYVPEDLRVLSLDLFMTALSKDKKNPDKGFGLVLPCGQGSVEKVFVKDISGLEASCSSFFKAYFPHL